jgi:hypothetical protein
MKSVADSTTGRLVKIASIDIEGGLAGWICMSVVPTPTSGFIVAFSLLFAHEQGLEYIGQSARFLGRADIPKVLQNSLYEGFVLGYGFAMVVRNVVEDTMLKGWEIYSELPKGSGYASFHLDTRTQWKQLIAYSKKEQTKRAKAGVNPATEIRNKHLACCIDSAVTLEISLAQDNALSESGRRHYRTNMELLSPLLYMEYRGIRYDTALVATELGQVKAALLECSTRLQIRTGKSLVGNKGSISSHKLKRLLYEEGSYPVQYKGRGPDKKPTTDVEALLKLQKKNPNDPLLSDILLHRKLESILETLEIRADPDGRVRCGYNLVGTETGRLTCYTSPTGSGANLQTITKKLRKLYTADAGYWFYQIDLAGADGWTVAAHCLRHGDPTMWDDYLFGLKPAKILALMLKYGSQVNTWTREQIAATSKEVDPDGAEYFVCKVVQHGTNYGMKEATMQKNVMVKSYNISGSAIYIGMDVCETLRAYYFLRYPGLLQWHKWAENEVLAGHNMISASGHERKFFGRRKGWNSRRRCVEVDHETWKEFLANEPQENTSYANNLTLLNQWTDTDNRIGGVYLREPGDTYRATRRKTVGGLIIEPFHTVHDANLGQFPRGPAEWCPTYSVEWATKKIRQWADNTLTIANTQVVIPFEGAYGPSWGEQGTKYGGGEI